MSQKNDKKEYFKDLPEDFKILVVEDDEEQLFVISDSLKRWGFKVAGVFLGKDAINYMIANSDALMLLDYNLPDMTGIDVISELKKYNEKINFITMTAYGNEKVAVDMMKSGAKDYVVKDSLFYDFLPSVVSNTVSRIVTEKKLIASEEALKETNKRYYELFENSQDAIYLSTVEGKFIDFNKSLIRLLGYTRDELMNLNTAILYDNPDYRKIYQYEMNTKGYINDFEVKFRRKSGEAINCLVAAAPIRDSKDQIIGYHGIMHDVSLRKKTEDELRKSEENYRNLFNRVPVGVYRTTPDGTFVDINPALLKIFGANSINELKQKNANDFFVDAKERKKWQDVLNREGIAVNYEFRLKNSFDEIKWLKDSARAILDVNGVVQYYEGVIEDITEKRLAEEEMQKLISDLMKSKETIEKQLQELNYLNIQLQTSEEELKKTNAAKDKFFSIIAHDLRSPFAGLLGLTKMISDDILQLTKDEILEMALAMNQSAVFIYDLLENLLHWSRVQGGIIEYNEEKINVLNIVQDNITLLINTAQQKNINLSSNIKDDLFVLFDKNILNTILRNLAANAIKFTYPGGTVQISAKALTDKIQFTVEDNGVGIDKTKLDMIFRIDKQFTSLGTSKEKGTGLGLVLCKDLIEKFGGEIWVESELGVGSKFFFTIPISQKKKN